MMISTAHGAFAQHLVRHVAQRKGDGVDEGAHVHGQAKDEADLEAGNVGQHLRADVGGDHDDRRRRNGSGGNGSRCVERQGAKRRASLLEGFQRTYNLLVLVRRVSATASVLCQCLTQGRKDAVTQGRAQGTATTSCSCHSLCKTARSCCFRPAVAFLAPFLAFRALATLRQTAMRAGRTCEYTRKDRHAQTH